MMRADNLPNWYEASLPARERKTRGHFSTPTQLVEDILDACGYTPERDLSELRVLDPACGSGNFLTSATKRLMAFGRHTGHSEQVITTLIQRNIWGFDPDPVACFLAEMHLSTICTNNLPLPERQQAPRLHIHQADALTLRWDKTANVDLFLANPPYLAAKNNDLSSYRSMQDHGQIDSYLLFVQLALRVTRSGGWIGLVLPDPLLARINAHQTRQFLLAETTIHHLWHLAGVFTAGVGAVVLIAQKCTPKKSHTISWQRERWSTLLARQANQSSSIVNGHAALLTGASRAKYVAQSLLLNQPHAELRYLLTEARGTLVERLHNQFQTQKAIQHLRPLADFVIIKRGEEIGKEHPLLKLAGQATTGLLESRMEAIGIVPNASVASPQATADPVPHTDPIPTVPDSSLQQGTSPVSQPAIAPPHWYPVLRGGIDIKPYSPPTAQWWIPRAAIRKPLERYTTPKLLLIKSMGRLQATLDLHHHVVLQTLYMLHLRPTYPTQRKKAPPENMQPQQQEDELYFLLALLNSHLLQEYVYILHTAYKWVQPQIEQHVLAQLPIPTPMDTSVKAQIISRARLLMQACREKNTDLELQREYNELYEEQERAICMLYASALTDTKFSVNGEQVS